MFIASRVSASPISDSAIHSLSIYILTKDNVTGWDDWMAMLRSQLRNCFLYMMVHVLFFDVLATGWWKLWANSMRGIIGRLTPFIACNIGKTMHGTRQIMPKLHYWAALSPGVCHQQILVIKVCIMVCIMVHINVLVQVTRDVIKLPQKFHLACTMDGKTWRGHPRHKNAPKIGAHAVREIDSTTTLHSPLHSQGFPRNTLSRVHSSLNQKSHPQRRFVVISWLESSSSNH